MLGEELPQRVGCLDVSRANLRIAKQLATARPLVIALDEAIEGDLGIALATGIDLAKHLDLLRRICVEDVGLGLRLSRKAAGWQPIHHDSLELRLRIAAVGSLPEGLGIDDGQKVAPARTTHSTLV